MNVFPNFDGLGGIGDLKAVIGAVLTIVLIVAVLMIIISAIIWAIATSTGNHAVASKARNGLLVAIGAAALAGCGVAWMNWLIQLGGQL
jgi:steroid 5-alpha reductase family enzyme